MFLVQETLKECAQCSAVNSDDESNCGVCGASLPSAPGVARNGPVKQTRDEARFVKGRIRSIMIGFLAVLSGIGLIATGLILISIFYALWPALITIPGMVLIMVGMDNLSENPIRPIFGARFWRLRGGRMSMQREAERQLEKQRKIESGEAD